jgi:hypothetical protein
MSKKLYLLIAVIVMVASILACGGSSVPPTNAPAPVATKATTAEPTMPPAEPTKPPVVASPLLGEPGTWLFMMYQDGDDQALEETVVFSVNEAELVGSTDKVKIVAQLDRYDGSYAGDGDWTSTRRYLLTQDDDLFAINSAVLEDLGEVDMGDPQTLYDFATWAMLTYPAEHYVLIMEDHGSGWKGGFYDNDYTSGLSMQEIDSTLGLIIAETYPKTGVNAFELIDFNACLMGQLEVMSSLAPHVRYVVASEELVPGIGYPYTSILKALNENPDMSGSELGQAYVDGYIVQDITITDDQARAVFNGGGSEESAAALYKDITLGVIDLGTMQALNAAVNELAVALTNIDQKTVSQARAYAQSYFDKSYIDLGHFVKLLLDNTNNPDLARAAQNVQSALAQSVVAEIHGPDRPGSSGLTIFFPDSEQYKISFLGADSGYEQYTSYVGRFATASLWDNFLTSHYTGQTFDPATANLAVLTPAESTRTDFSQAVAESAPDASAEITAPGSGDFTIAPLTVSASEVSLDGILTITTEITGSNIAYVYYSVSYWNDEYGSYLTADSGYLNSADGILEIGGVNYPNWGDKGVAIEYAWKPLLYYMSDGNEANDQFALFAPTVYSTETIATFTVRGTYTFTDSGNTMSAKMNFVEGKMQSVWGFTGDSDSSGAWSEIKPNPGDTFTITNEWLQFDKNPEGEFVDYPGGTMTFGDTPFTVAEYYAFTGKYSIGIGVQDFDGNTVWEFTEVSVTE